MTILQQKRYYQLFLPLIVLMLLSCPMKREIKQLLGVMPASTSLYESTEKDKVTDCRLQYNNIRKAGKDTKCDNAISTMIIASSASLPPFLFSVPITKTTDELVLTKRFIHFRKLII